MPAGKHNHDPLRTAEVLTLLQKHRFRRGKSTIGSASSEFLQWCQGRELPEAICDHFARCSLRGTGMEFGCGYLFGETDIIQSHESDTQLLAAALFQIGSCPNGDLVVLDLKDGRFPVAFVSHEQYWAPNPPPPRKYSVRVADSLYGFLHGWAEATLPCDYFEASGGA